MKRNSGFTLIEVMVATTILLLMTVMMGALFRQASSTWDAGNAQAEGGMIVRGVVGAITRDLATAVDARDYPSAGLGKNKAFSFDSSSLTFVCLKPSGKMGDARIGVPHLIKYSLGSGVTRHDKVRNAAGEWVDYKGPNGTGKQPATLFDPQASAGFSAVFSFEEIALAESDPGDSDRSGFDDSAYLWNGPGAVKLTLSLTQNGRFSGLSVLSWGPNGKTGPSEDEGDEDDILVK